MKALLEDLSQQRAIFCVIDQPYCVWSSNIAGENDRFLRSIQAGVYDRFAKQQARRNLENEKSRREAGALVRLFWHHSFETLVSLIGASLQAPNCVFGYFAKCRNDDVRSLAQSLLDGNPLDRAYVRPTDATWVGYLRALYSFTPWANKDDHFIEHVGKALRWMAQSYVAPAHRLEFNALKHGLRLVTGPAALHIGEPEGAADSEAGIKLSAKDSSFLLDLQPLKGVSRAKQKVHQQVERVMIGWSLERSIRDIGLAAMMIGNVASFIRCVQGDNPKTCKFNRPVMEEEWWENYFSDHPDLLNFTFRETFSFADKNLESAEQIQAHFRTGKAAGASAATEPQ